jgi:hypothetical protein
MPRLTSFGPTENVFAICGNAVAITVVSKYSMKKAAATTKGSTLKFLDSEASAMARLGGGSGATKRS